MLPRDDKYERRIGAVFNAGESMNVRGEIGLRRGDLLNSIVLSIYADSFLHVGEGKALHGVSGAGRVSLLDCVRGSGLRSTYWSDFTIHHGEVPFRYALFGTEHVTADEKRIRSMRFNLKGVDKNLFGWARIDAFGWIRDPHEEILEESSRTRPDDPKGDCDKTRARVSYFTGNYELLPRTETRLGTISAWRTINIRMETASEGSPYIDIDFYDEPTTVEGAWSKMREVRQFFAWIMGYAPAWSDVVMFTSKRDDDGARTGQDGRPDERLKVFGSNEWEETTRGNWHGGMVINAAEHAEHFMAVMETWLDRNRDARRKSANERYFNSMEGMGSGLVKDGIVGAANTFDLLPSEDKPPSGPINEALSEILKDARERIRKTVKETAQRDEVLNALGRINAGASLRSVVQHKAKLVVEHFGGEQLPSFDEVIRQAIACRNHYTHGPHDEREGEVDFYDPNVVLFLTETLRFIYATSELLLCGWNESKSQRYDWHPLGRYVKGYARHRSLVRLK